MLTNKQLYDYIRDSARTNSVSEEFSKCLVSYLEPSMFKTFIQENNVNPFYTNQQYDQCLADGHRGDRSGRQYLYIDNSNVLTSKASFPTPLQHIIMNNVENLIELQCNDKFNRPVRNIFMFTAIKRVNSDGHKHSTGSPAYIDMFGRQTWFIEGVNKTTTIKKLCDELGYDLGNLSDEARFEIMLRI